LGYFFTNTSGHPGKNHLGVGVADRVHHGGQGVDAADAEIRAADLEGIHVQHIWGTFNESGVNAMIIIIGDFVTKIILEKMFLNE
jgi:hypothetical protein